MDFIRSVTAPPSLYRLHPLRRREVKATGRRSFATFCPCTFVPLGYSVIRYQPGAHRTVGANTVFGKRLSNVPRSKFHHQQVQFPEDSWIFAPTETVSLTLYIYLVLNRRKTSWSFHNRLIWIIRCIVLL